ncbi:MAG: pectate lyase, partial [Pseudomonadota bacterium]
MNFYTIDLLPRRGLSVLGLLGAALVGACGAETSAPASAAPAPSSLQPGASNPDSPASTEMPSATPPELVTPMTIVAPSPSESPNTPVSVAPNTDGMGVLTGKDPVLPPVTVDCSLAPAGPVQVAWDDVNDQDASWYSTAEALTIAENVLYYQNADRGWPKNIDMTVRAAARGEQSMIDNDATTTQIDFLARVYAASGCSAYGDAARSGIEYLLEAQYDNGGWPQRFPNPQGYPAHITYNDNAM